MKSKPTRQMEHNRTSTKWPLLLGAETRWGKVAAMGIREGERWYMMIDKRKTVSLIPAELIRDYPADARLKREEFPACHSRNTGANEQGNRS